MPRALILGGTGLIGRATARRLLAAGWRVDVTGRVRSHLPGDIAAAGGRFLIADGDAREQFRAAVGLVSTYSSTASASLPLTRLGSCRWPREAGSTVMISSKAVYVDAARHHSNSATGPRFSGPVRETQPTMAPSDGRLQQLRGLRGEQGRS